MCKERNLFCKHSEHYIYVFIISHQLPLILKLFALDTIFYIIVIFQLPGILNRVVKIIYLETLRTKTTTH